MCENGNKCSNIATHPRYHQIAHGEYDRALRDAFWHGVRTKFQRKTRDLIPFEEAHHHIRTSSHTSLGIMDVEIDRIIGSSGRYRDFDVNYLPKRRVKDDRWVNVAQAHFEGITLPPVMLYQIQDAYYVEDGNHRVSVARLLKHKSIRAQVVTLTSEGGAAAD